MSFPMVALGELLKPINRSESVDPEKEYRILGAHWYAKGLYVKDIKLGSEIQANKVYRIEKGDFVYNRLFAWKGSFAVATDENHGCYVSNEFPCFKVDSDRADSKYLWLYFSRAKIWEEAFGLSTGGTPTSRNRLKEGKFLAMQISLPPLPEQRRIVARIEELAAKIEEARGLRRKAAEEAAALVYAESKMVFSLKRTADHIIKLGEVAKRITKGESPEWQGFAYQDSGPIFVRSENVLWGKLDLSKTAHISEEFHQKLSRSQLFKGDVLINLVGASIGRACVVPDTIGNANVNQAVAVISFDLGQLDSDYLIHFLLSPLTQDIIHGGKVETARPNISLGGLRKLIIPIPPLPEQLRIVAYLDSLQAKVDALKRLQTDTGAELDALMPAVLDRAFKGEL